MINRYTTLWKEKKTEESRIFNEEAQRNDKVQAELEKDESDLLIAKLKSELENYSKNKESLPIWNEERGEDEDGLGELTENLNDLVNPFINTQGSLKTKLSPIISIETLLLKMLTKKVKRNDSS